jgi:hypothetical protein
MVKNRKFKDKTFDPVKEQLEMLLEYINLIEKKPKDNVLEDITVLISLIMHIKQQCIIYLSNEIRIQGNKNGRDYSL